MPILATFTLPKNILSTLRRPAQAIQVSPLLSEVAAFDADQVYHRLGTSEQGLSSEEAARRLDEHGPNVVAKEQHFRRTKLLLHACRNPLVILLLVLAALSWYTEDIGAPRLCCPWWCWA